MTGCWRRPSHFIEKPHRTRDRQCAKARSHGHGGQHVQPIRRMAGLPARKSLLATPRRLTAIVIASAGIAAADEVKLPAAAYFGPPYNWTGFYAGGNMGIGWGKSNWNAGPGISGSTDLFQTIDTFDEAGSFFAGVQGGYNYVLPNRILLGAKVDASFPAFRSLPSGVNPFGVSVGGISTTAFFAGTQPINSNFSVQEVRAGVNYMFDNSAALSAAPLVFKGPAVPGEEALVGGMKFDSIKFRSFRALGGLAIVLDDAQDF